MLTKGTTIQNLCGIYWTKTLKKAYILQSKSHIKYMWNLNVVYLDGIYYDLLNLN